MPASFPCVALIPARYDSTRFPGKPLASILGRPMFWHVVTRARESPYIDQAYLATDDQRIADRASGLGIPAIMTAKEHASGTDRILEAAKSLDLSEDTVVVNVQGDEPCLDPRILDQLVQPFSKEQVQVSTVARSSGSQSAQDPNLVKVARAHSGQALYFSRAPIPFPREPDRAEYLIHIGLYAFRLPVLRRFHHLGPSPLEEVEKLEQLRLLEAGIPIHVVLTTYQCYGVDRPDDVAQVEAILREEQHRCRQY